MHHCSCASLNSCYGCTLRENPIKTQPSKQARFRLRALWPGVAAQIASAFQQGTNINSLDLREALYAPSFPYYLPSHACWNTSAIGLTDRGHSWEIHKMISQYIIQRTWQHTTCTKISYISMFWSFLLIWASTSFSLIRKVMFPHSSNIFILFWLWILL